MKAEIVVATALALTSTLTVTTGCDHVATIHVQQGQVQPGQAVNLDARTKLLVSTEGGPGQPPAPRLLGSPTSKEPIHRVLETSDGNVLFGYDLQVGKADSAGSYRLILRPAATGPTFRKSREVTVENRDAVVRVELMEQPETGKKIVDVFRLADRTDADLQAELNSPLAHLKAFHDHIFHMLHGQ